jgi:hypothetical protein
LITIGRGKEAMKEKSLINLNILMVKKNHEGNEEYEET